MSEDGTKPAPARCIDPRVILPLCVTAFAGAVNLTGLPPFFSEIAAELDSTVPVIGQSTTVLVLTAGFVGLVVGPVADHYGFRRVLLVGALAAGLSALGTALAPAVLPLMAARSLGGVGSSISIGVSLGVAMSLFSGVARLRAISLIGASLSLATAAGPPALTALGSAIGWRGAYGAVAAFSLLPFFLVLVLLPGDGRAAARFSPASILEAYRPLLRDRSTLILYGVWTLRAVTWIGMLSYLGAYATEQLGLSTGAAGLIYMGAGIGNLLGSLSIGGRIGRLDLRLVTSAALAVMSLAWIGLYVSDDNLSLVLASLAVATVLGGVSQVSLTSLVANESRARPATAMVMTEAVLSFGGAFGGAAGGLLLGFGGYAYLGFGLSFATIIAAVLVLAQRSRRTTAIPDEPYGFE